MERIIPAAVLLLSVFVGSTNGALMLGLLDDFEDGTLGGWAPPAGNTQNVPGGPVGSTRYLEIAPAQRLGAFDAGVNGVIDPAVTAIEVDMFRPVGLSALEIRLTLMGPGPGNRWTSTTAQPLPGDGIWRTYTFGILESDLTQVLGGSSYAALTNSLNRIHLRHDTGGPSAGGTPVSPDIGVFGIDNVNAIPEPASIALLGLGGVMLMRRRSAPRSSRRGRLNSNIW